MVVDPDGEADTATLLSVPDGPPPLFDRGLEARRLAVAVDAAISRAGVATVLLTSPASATGKSYLTELIGPEMDRVEPDTYLVVGYDALEDLDPAQRSRRVVIVDGPPMLTGGGPLSIPDRWMHTFDAAILVVMGRRTRVAELHETVEWLRNARIQPIGIIFNEHECPEPLVRVQRWYRFVRTGQWREGLRRLFRLRPRRTGGAS